MERPARVTGGHRVLPAVHTFIRIVLVCALVGLLTLIAMREVQGIAASAVPRPVATSTISAAPSPGTSSSVPAPTSSPPAAALIAPRGGGA